MYKLPTATATVVSAVIASFGHYGVLLGPLAGGLALMITRIGLDAFCLWASEEVEELRQVEKATEFMNYAKRGTPGERRSRQKRRPTKKTIC